LRNDLLYVDSNVFLYPVIYDEKAVVEAKKSREFLLKIALAKVEACTSSVTWDEVVWVIRRLFGIENSVEEGKRFLGFPNLRVLGVRKSTVFKAQELVERYKLKPRDALHAAVALENKIKTIVSYDDGFNVITEIERIEP